MTITNFSKPQHDRYFEDYQVGTTYDLGSIEVEEEEVLSFARRFDPQKMHTDPEAAAAGPFQGLIASGWHTLSLMMRLMVDNYVSTVAGLASPGVDEVRWHKPVRPGDRLSMRATVLEARPSRSKPDRGLIYSLMEGVNQHGEVVASFKGMGLILKRPV
ncbi:MaoC family dehydratase [Alloalcanivorax xenomutans]|jgi:acyl dehydratase|uniref:MaoC family dehydratase n=1 Tax=Alloalcanivorax xenomutans TaxID=1094342 RepID=UPI0003B857A7|nr:MaoC family dehydratase [Alloalcanivorax xenomutans]ERS09450.1 MaoC family dehydratase [Alcanivorax sp. PN-3]MBA4719693.1 MaoC family dehydratase [Alcanivorax sp.]ARB47701.1 acyl dehydratase [Alloalcanivorax xenomutans]MCE7523629.1 MaoC family dehydratase [Alloalcanivorax xenomutans]WOA31457.1 MaoC family dehydratase [Alloalcanivorax xenomutans]